jgi:hypothetical protein
MSRPLRTAATMISEELVGVKYVRTDGVTEVYQTDPSRGLVSRDGSGTHLR